MPDAPVPYAKAKDKKWVSEKPGAPTARYAKLIKVPVKYLSRLPGLRGEHEVLHPEMDKVQCFIPLVKDLKFQREHPIELEVHHNGGVYIADGNHRALAASLAHIDNYLCKVTFYGGSEEEVKFDKLIKKYALLEKFKVIIAESTQVNPPEPWRENPYTKAGKVDLMPIAWMKQFPYNKLRYNPAETGGGPDGKTGSLVSDIKQNGIQHPLMMEFGKDDHRITLGEGNHRLLAAELAGHTHVPVRMQRNSTLNPEQSYSSHGDPMSRLKPGEYFPGECAPSDVFDNFEKIGGISAKPKLKEASMNINNLISQARRKITAGENIADISRVLTKLADEQSIGGATDLDGSPGDQEYAMWREEGEDLAGENDPNKGDQRRTGPRPPNDMVQEASSNKPCEKCGMPTDQCVCMDDKMPTNGKNPTKTTPKVDPRMDAYKQAEINLKNALITHGKMSRVASHMEQIEIPFSDLNLEAGIDYHMSGPGAHQNVTQLVRRYLRSYVYPDRRAGFTIARLEQENNKIFASVLIFDNQIAHEASVDTKPDTLHKVSNVESKNLTKTAWKKRLTETLGANDSTGLVSCPLESHFMTRSCAICPLAGNPETYIKEGSVDCHFDDMNLSGDRRNHTSDVREHRPYQR